MRLFHLVLPRAAYVKEVPDDGMSLNKTDMDQDDEVIFRERFFKFCPWARKAGSR